MLSNLFHCQASRAHSQQRSATPPSPPPGIARPARHLERSGSACKQSAHDPLRPSPPCLCLHGARAAAHQRLLFSRRRLREKVRPPVYRLGGSSLAASCQPQAAPAPAHVAYACLAALRCASAGHAPARERHWQGTATA